MSEDPSSADDPRRRLTPVYVVIEEPRVRDLMARFSRTVVIEAAQEAMASFRSEFRPDAGPPPMDAIVARVEAIVAGIERDRLRPVVNATGIVLHTGLGRAVLPRRAVEALAGMDRPCNMQVDLETGRRGKRMERTEALLRKLTGAEAAMVVNNNAAATHLVLSALCPGREVIVSRGQLIEIGGSFRLPSCIEQSGAVLVEVGTTNRTHLRDYEEALSPNTGAVFRANPSNYRVVGFSKEVPILDLVGLKKRQQVLVIDDLGCGCLVDTSQFGLPKELTVQESVAAGADLVLFSGDKLIGGPQAGIVVGKKDLIAKVKKHPLTRMMRACKLTDAVLEATLRLFLDPEALLEANPTLRMLSTPAAKLEARARTLAARIAAEAPIASVAVREGESEVGGGSLPATPLRTWVLAVACPPLSADDLSLRLRLEEPPVIARIHEGEVLLDMRTLLDGDDDAIAGALRRIGGAA
jgi:L-seryl-tRNA(Ser) seleniumtransferase